MKNLNDRSVFQQAAFTWSSGRQESAVCETKKLHFSKNLFSLIKDTLSQKNVVLSFYNESFYTICVGEERAAAKRLLNQVHSQRAVRGAESFSSGDKAEKFFFPAHFISFAWCKSRPPTRVNICAL